MGDYDCCILFVVSYSQSHSVFGYKSFSLIFFYITELDLCINWASNVALLSWKLSYCIIVFSCHLGPSHSVPIISLACSGLPLVLPQPLLMAALGWHLPPSCWLWVLEQNKFLFCCLFLIKTTWLSSCIVVSGQSGSGTLALYGWSSSRERKVGNLTLGFAQIVWVVSVWGGWWWRLLLGFRQAQVWDGAWCWWKASDASWLSRLWIPITPLFLRALREFSVVSSPQCAPLG